MSEPQATIPKGSLVLVTGATGYVGSHVTKQLLQRGYKVRGTVRDISQATWLTDETFSPHSQGGNLELVVVPDMAAPNAFNEAVKGVSAIAHVATISSFDIEPSKVVGPNVAGAMEVFEAAAKEPSVKEVVFTSSIVAATFPSAGNDTFVKRDTWNDMATQLAYAPPPYGPAQWFFTYAESKVAAEKAVWKFMEERKPHFNVNVINPSGIMGEPLHKKHVGTLADYMSIVFKGDAARLSQSPGAYFIDVEDVAAIHIAAILDPETKNARLQAWSHRVSWNDILAILKKIRPQHEFIRELEDTSLLTIETEQSECVSLIKKWTSRDSWKSLKESVTENVNSPLFPY